MRGPIAVHTFRRSPIAGGSGRWPWAEGAGCDRLFALLGLLAAGICLSPGLAPAQFLEFRRIGVAEAAHEILVGDVDGDGTDEVISCVKNYVYVYKWTDDALALADQLSYRASHKVMLAGMADLDGDGRQEFCVSETNQDSIRIHVTRCAASDSFLTMAELILPRSRTPGSLNTQGHMTWDVAVTLVGRVPAPHEHGDIVFKSIAGFSGQPRGLIAFAGEPPHALRWQTLIGPCPEEDLPAQWGSDAASTRLTLAAAGYGNSQTLSGLKSTESAVVVCDGSGGVLWTRSLAGSGTSPHAALADLTGDGTMEIIVATEQQASEHGTSALLRTFSLDGKALGELDTGTSVLRMAVANVREDRRPEILVACRNGELRMYDGDLTLLRSVPVVTSHHCTLIAADLDGRGDVEVYLSREGGMIDVFGPDLQKVGEIETDGIVGDIFPARSGHRQLRAVVHCGERFCVYRAVRVPAAPWLRVASARPQTQAQRFGNAMIGFAGAVALFGIVAGSRRLYRSRGDGSVRALVRELAIVRHGERQGDEKRELLDRLRRNLETGSTVEGVQEARDAIPALLKLYASYFRPALVRVRRLSVQSMPIPLHLDLARRQAAAGRALRELESALTSADDPSRIAGQCRRASQAVLQLQGALRRIEARALELVPADPVAEAAAACAALRSRMDSAGVELEGIRSTGLVGSRVFIEPALLRRCVHDIVANSIEATSQAAEPRIGIHIACGERKVVLAVEDNGCGIAPERWDSIFHGDSDKAIPGGKGLAHAREAVESYSGKILVRESRPWETTTVEIELHRLPS